MTDRASMTDRLIGHRRIDNKCIGRQMIDRYRETALCHDVYK